MTGGRVADRPLGRWLLPLILALLVVGIGLAGALHVRAERRNIVQQQRDALVAVAEAKASAIVGWTRERRDDALTILSAAPLVAWLERAAVAPPAAPPDQELLRWLASLVETHGYRTALLVAGDGRIVVRWPPSAEDLFVFEREFLDRARAGDQPVLSDFEAASEGGPAMLDLAVPLRAAAVAANAPALLLRIDPRTLLAPLVRGWPTAHGSGVSLVVKRRGDGVLRFDDDSSAAAFAPVAVASPPAGSPSALVRDGREGFVDGLDYRGVPVLAVVRKIPGTAWSLVARMDREEIEGPTRRSAFRTAVVTGALIVAAVLLVGTAWRRQRGEERRRTEAAVAERAAVAQHFETLADRVNDIIVLADADGRIVQANDRAMEAYGYSHDELLGMRIDELRAEPARAAMTDDLARVRTDGGARFETVHVRRDGSRFPVEVSARWLNIDGSYFTQGIVRDISERARLEGELRESAGKYRALFEGANDGVLLLRDVSFVDCNARAAEMFGCDRAEVLASTPIDFSPEIQPDGRRSADKARDLVAAARRGESIRFEWEHRRRDGTGFFAEVSLSAVEIAGERLVQAIMRDVTDRIRAEQRLREANERLRLLVEGTPHFFFYLQDLDAATTYVSPSVATITGRTPAEWIGQHHWFVTDNPINDEAIRRTRAHLRGEFDGEPVLVEVRHADGHPVLLEALETGRYEDGRLVGIQGIAHDVTEQVRARERIDLLAHAVRSIGEGVSVTDSDDRIVFVNAALCEMYGYTEAELLGKTFGMLRSPVTDPAVASAILPATLGGGWSGELWNRRKDGTDFPVSLSTSIVRDESGRPLALIGVVRDITERRRAERVEKKQLGQLALVNRIAHHVAALLDADELLRTAVREIRDSFSFHHVTLLHVDRGRGELSRQVLAGAYESLADPDYRQKVGEGLIGLAAQTGATVVSDDTTTDPRYLAGFGAGSPTRSEVAVPITVGGVVVGVLDVQETSVAAFDATDVQTLETLAEQLAVSVENARLFGDVQRELAERRRAEAALQEALAWQEQIFEGSQDAVFISDEDSRFTAVNRAATRLTGYTREELLSMRIQDLHEDVDLHAYEAYHDRIMRGEQIVSEAAVRRKDGGKIDAEFSNTVFGIGDRRFMHTTARDVGERRRSEAALRDSEARYRTLAETANDLIIVLGLDGHILYCNKRALDVGGYTLEEARELHIADVIAPAYRNAWQLRWQRRTEGDQSRYLYELELLTRDGRTIPVEVNTSAMAEDGVTRGILVVARDISQRVESERALRASEERYRQLVELAPETIYVHSGRRVVFINPAGVALLGARSADDVLRRPIWDFIHPDLHAVVEQRIRAIEETGEPAPLLEERFVRLDGAVVTVEVGAAPTTFGGLPAVQVVVRDVSERKSLQAQLLQSQKMEALGRVAGGVAHDFNNLLQAMLTTLQLLALRPGDAQAASSAATELEAMVKRGASLARQLLLFARQSVTKPERIDLNVLVHDASRFLGRLVPDNLRLEIETAPGELPVDADHGQLEQVLTNLVVNAVDAMPGGGTVTLRTGRLDRGFVWMEIQDEGFGIAPADVERIFDPFFTTKPPGKGTGLGLAVVHGIVTQHGGRVTVATQVGGGTTFRVVLPRRDAGSHAKAAESSPAARAGSGERILIVEDNRDVRQLLARLLEQLGYAVTAVESGEEAALLPPDVHFDLLVTDVMLPGASGIEVAVSLRERWPGLSVILMSGYAEDEVIRHGITEGRFRFLQKPVDLDTLAREVRTALGE